MLVERCVLREGSSSRAEPLRLDQLAGQRQEHLVGRFNERRAGNLYVQLARSDTRRTREAGDERERRSTLFDISGQYLRVSARNVDGRTGHHGNDGAAHAAVAQHDRRRKRASKSGDAQSDHHRRRRRSRQRRS